MPQWRTFGENQQIWRPLLTVSRDELQRYADEQGLSYIEDPSNADNSLLRNWLRNEALPLWQDRVPQLDQQLSAGIQLLQQQLAVLDEVAEADAAWLEEAVILTVGVGEPLARPSKNSSCIISPGVNI